MRRAFTLVEAMLALALVVVVLATLFTIFGRGTALSAQAAAQLALQADARALVDALVDDVHAALYIEEPRAAADFAKSGRIVVFRPSSADPAQRVARNAEEGPSYPFLSDKETTVQHLDARKVVYERKGEVVTRTESGGFLTRTLQPDASFAYGWNPDARVAAPHAGTTRLCERIAELAVAPLALARDAKTGTRALVAMAGADAPRQDQACLLLVAFTCRQPGMDAPAGQLAMTTKIWVSDKLLAFRFPEFFSTVDENLGY